MESVEVCSLTEASIAKLLTGRHERKSDAAVGGRRKMPRWPFPGTVQLWIPDENGVDEHTLATSVNLSEDGVGILVDDELPIDLELTIALHEPEASLQGRAVVRHCTRIDERYYMGLQFVFDGP